MPHCSSSSCTDAARPWIKSAVHSSNQGWVPSESEVDKQLNTGPTWIQDLVHCSPPPHWDAER